MTPSAFSTTEYKPLTDTEPAMSAFGLPTIPVSNLTQPPTIPSNLPTTLSVPNPPHDTAASSTASFSTAYPEAPPRMREVSNPSFHSLSLATPATAPPRDDRNPVLTYSPPRRGLPGGYPDTPVSKRSTGSWSSNGSHDGSPRGIPRGPREGRYCLPEHFEEANSKDWSMAVMASA
ncbi:hypothetical protein BT63DRAFT_422734 [Microthyrium microscopicum]|uniref:Uncharacterized protein n=1 Tax=Microthyrium microscopicum TaxID=703497 RepID=A0A6A6UJ33_9PEZI|nr:hypothetical protein BT63DRAFT_422734 [Microthyrium microscopicum]